MWILGVLLFFVVAGVFLFSILEVSGRESDMEEERDVGGRKSAMEEERECNETAAVSNLGHQK